MKGVILSTSFFILIFALFLSLGWYIHYDHSRSLINNNFKKSFFQTAHLLKEHEEVDEDKIMDVFINEIKNSLPNNFDYEFELLGFNYQPLLMRIRLKTQSKNNFYSFTLEETLIEKELVDD